MRFFIITVVFLLYLQNISFAQSDFVEAQIVSNNKDTIHGLVRKKIVETRFIDFRKDAESKITRESADNIAAVIQNGELTIASYPIVFDGKKQHVFIEKILGNVELGLFKGKHEGLGNICFISEKSLFKSLNVNDLNTSYGFLYAKCGSFDLSQNFKKTEKDIIKQFQLYSECIGIEQNNSLVDYRRKNPNVYIGPKLGYLIGNISHSNKAYYSEGDYSGFSSLVLCAGFKTVFHSGIYLESDLTHYSKKSTSDYVNTPPLLEEDIFSQVTYDLSLLDLQISFGYSFLKNSSLRPFVGAGLNYGILIKSDLIRETNGIPEEDRSPPFIDFGNSRDFGGFFAIGSTYAINQNNMLQLTIQARYSSMHYIVFRNSDLKGGYGTGNNLLISRMGTILFSYYLKLGKN